MLDAFIRELTEDLKRLLKAHGPTVAFVKVKLSDGRSLTVWPDGSCTFLTENPAEVSAAGAAPA